MPPRAQPRPKPPPPRRGRGVNQDNESEQALSAPSPKATFENNDDLPDAPITAKPIDVSEIQPPHPESTDTPHSTPTPSASSPPPSRQSRQRLASVLPRSYSNSPSTANQDGEFRPAVLKFKPKSNARKSKEAREALEKADAEREAARRAADGSSVTSERGGYYAGGRGRGGFNEMARGRDLRFNLSHGATGHLGGSTVGETSGRRGRGGSGGSGGGVGGGGGGDGGGGRGGNRGAKSGTSDSTSTRTKTESAVKGEKDKDGDTIMGSSIAKSKPKRAKIKKEDQAPTYVSSDEEFDSDGREKMDIERINLITDDEESENESGPFSEIAQGKKRQRQSQPRLDPMRPVRIQRQEHVERAVVVNTDASSLTSAELRRRAKERNEAGGSLFLPDEEEAEILHTRTVKGKKKAKDVEFLKDERKWKGVYQDEDEKDSIAKIKDEPGDDDDVMLVDKPLEHEGPERMAVDEEEAIPICEAFKNTLPDISSAVPQVPHTIDQTARDIADIEDDTLQHPDDERVRAGHYHDAKLSRTHEEKQIANAECTAEAEEIAAILSEISPASTPMPKTKTETTDDPSDLSHEAATLVPITEGANYTFQLPPLLPSLRSSKKPAPPEKEKQKENPPKPKPPPESSKPSTTTSTNPFATPIKEDPDQKPDPDALGPIPNIPHTYISGGIYHPTGIAGSLRIHKGGKIGVDWGGLEMVVERVGCGRVSMAQELFVTEWEGSVVKREEEGGWEERIRVGGKGWGVGVTRPGFVGCPDLGRLLG